MWWPSFVAVLHDLWSFLFGRREIAIASAPQVATTPFHREPARQQVAAAQSKVSALSVGVVYDAQHPATIAIRSQLGTYDQHIVKDGPLTSGEWLIAHLLQQRASLPALALYMTPVGNWHTTLKGQSGVSVGITPRTQALMEWPESVTVQKAGLVKTVSPAEAITLGQLSDSGLYTEATYDRATWLELRPVFTSV